MDIRPVVSCIDAVVGFLCGKNGGVPVMDGNTNKEVSKGIPLLSERYQRSRSLIQTYNGQLPSSEWFLDKFNEWKNAKGDELDMEIGEPIDIEEIFTLQNLSKNVKGFFQNDPVNLFITGYNRTIRKLGRSM